LSHGQPPTTLAAVASRLVSAQRPCRGAWGCVPRQLGSSAKDVTSHLAHPMRQCIDCSLSRLAALPVEFCSRQLSTAPSASNPATCCSSPPSQRRNCPMISQCSSPHAATGSLALQAGCSVPKLSGRGAWGCAPKPLDRPVRDEQPACTPSATKHCSQSVGQLWAPWKEPHLKRQNRRTAAVRHTPLEPQAGW